MIAKRIPRATLITHSKSRNTDFFGFAADVLARSRGFSSQRRYLLSGLVARKTVALLASNVVNPLWRLPTGPDLRK